MHGKGSGISAAPSSLARTVRDLASSGILVLAVWLAWQIVCAPLVERAPVDVAVRLAPSSPRVLQRAAEAELAAGRFEDAEFLARRALVAAPFTVRSLSTLGIAIAGTRGDAAADDILTLAGNWSLRDDPTHAWLMHARLKTGDYGSAFAHADTLARRRTDVRSEVFHLFSTAAAADARSVPALVGLLSRSPPWRSAFFEYLYAPPHGDSLLATLAVGLQTTASPLDDAELGHLYSHWVGERRTTAIRIVRTRIGRPAASILLVDGSFSGESAPPPFAWTFKPRAGLLATVTEDDLRRGEEALRVEYDGTSIGAAGVQMLQLAPGTYRLTFEARRESGSPAPPLIWRLNCGDEKILAEVRPRFAAGASTWRSFDTAFTVPIGCDDQWLTLDVRPSDVPAVGSVIWFDRVMVQPAPRRD